MFPVHGEDGWELVEYDWNEDTGKAEFFYERTVDGKLETQYKYFTQHNFWVHPALREELTDLLYD